MSESKHPFPQMRDLELYPLEDRESLVEVKDFCQVPEAVSGFGGFVDSLPDIYAGADFKVLVERIIRARLAGKPVVELLGGTPGRLRAYASSMKRDITPEDEAARLVRLAISTHVRSEGDALAAAPPPVNLRARCSDIARELRLGDDLSMSEIVELANAETFGPGENVEGRLRERILNLCAELGI